MKTIQEEFQERLDRFKKDMTHLVKNGFEEVQGVPTTVFAMIRAENKWGIAIVAGLGQLMEDDSDKDVFIEAIKRVKSDIKPLAIAVVTEAWSSKVDKDKRTGYIDPEGEYVKGVTKPSEDPNRKEIVMISFETFDKECSHIWDIKRDGDKAILSESEINSGAEGWVDKGKNIKGGRFSNLLDENYNEFVQQYKDSENLN